ncbi:MAG: HD domain-containing protein [Deltaproteobacteria bacterium]|nr:HD domain-containing protein [Deltaproteobacteria bacterium]
MDKAIEHSIKDIVKPLLEKGRNGDWGHTLRVVEYGKYLLQHEEGDEEIVTPSLYLHDIGWSSVNFDDFRHASPESKRKTLSLSLHMKYGAVLAREILKDLGYDPRKTNTIITIIAIHDEPDKVFAMENPSATLVVESDRMDRYGPESIKRFTTMFGESYLKGDQWKQAATHLRDGLELWFRTKPGKALAEKLARDTRLLI